MDGRKGVVGVVGGGGGEFFFWGGGGGGGGDCLSNKGMVCSPQHVPR